MNLRTIADMIHKQYGYRVRPTDIRAWSRVDGSIYFRLPDGRNGIVAEVTGSEWLLPLIEKRVAA